MADGGEGTFEVLVRGLNALPVTISTVGPWGDAIDAAIGLAPGGTAVVELASASGLNLPSIHKRDPVAASSYGTGVLMAEAARLGALPDPGRGRMVPPRATAVRAPSRRSRNAAASVVRRW
ncbi:glycerate kinase [Pseudarthrobacter sp. So.54]